MPTQEEIDKQEQEIRENLEKQLGVEFCSPADLAAEQKIAEAEKKIAQFTPKSKVEPPQITITELITRCNEAGQLMSVKNPNRHLLWLCASALKELSERLYKYEMKVN